jgi:tetratricopeptide (TPR) repeat protein
MKIPLEGARARWSFLVGIILIAGTLAFVAGKVWLAAHWSASLDPQRLLRAANLQPRDAAYWYRLGLYETWNVEQPDVHLAVIYYQRATAVNPRSDQYWMALADALEAIGQTARAREAFERAQAGHPISSDVAWRYGNFLLRQRSYSDAFTEMHRALVTDPDLTVQAVSECSKAVDDLPRILTEVLPNQTRYYLLALNYFVSQHQTDAALAVWDRLLGLKQIPEMAQVVPFINELIHAQRVGEAQRVWREALRATNWPQEGSGNRPLVFNGGFEHDLLNGAFDWREDPIPGAAFHSDADVVHAGKRALRVTFDGSANLDFHNLWQFCPVEPSHRYHFAAYLRLVGISTDSGLRFAIYDPFHSAAPQILTPNLVGSHAWSPVEEDFVTGPETQLIIVALRRVPSWKFDNKLSGTVWVDDVSLTPATGGPEESSR